MEGKYGRLFTEDDMRQAIAGAVIEVLPFAPDEVIDAAQKLVLEGTEGAAAPDWTFPADEPLFLLRAQDKITPGVVASYVGGTYAHGCSEEHRRSAEEAYERIRAWQTVHPDRVKVPD